MFVNFSVSKSEGFLWNNLYQYLICCLILFANFLEFMAIDMLREMDFT